MDFSRPILFLFLSLSSFLPIASPATIFNFSTFAPNTIGISFSGDAFSSSDNTIQLTSSIQLGSVGHAIYSAPINLSTATNFTTRFVFRIDSDNQSSAGDGFAFFLAAVGYDIPPKSDGSGLGLFNITTNGNSSVPKVVAVEFDTYSNEGIDPDGNHIGIDLNSETSKVTTPWNTTNDAESVTVMYDSSGRRLYVCLDHRCPVLTCNVNLSELLPETVIIGFSASTGNKTESHSIISWDFETSFSDEELAQARALESNHQADIKENTSWVVVVVAVLVVLLAVGLGCLLIVLCWCRKKSGGYRRQQVPNSAMDNELMAFPRKFTYRELVEATNNFREDGKLGQGGFGVVYQGLLNGNEVAIKKQVAESVQGEKEFVSEVTTISKLRHRNLVKLIGWCHEKDEFLIVYDYMPNGSLDGYLFGKKGCLDWKSRYSIARGLAAALLYLQEECEQCVLHRDIKPSNVMLDSGLNARLGDFGLARMVAHELGGQTTLPAGTRGYMAPEYMETGRASRESDVFSFGVVALEIVCGRKAVDLRARKEEEVSLVAWVWGMYERGRIIEAADGRLGDGFDEREMERLLVVGLWCAHPDCEARPTMKEAIEAMTLRVPAPTLPLTMPRWNYAMPLPRVPIKSSSNVGAQASFSSRGT